MIVKEWQENKIIDTLTAFEQSQKGIQYDKVYTWNDGRDSKGNSRKQITLSIGFTEDGGNLGKLLRMYCLMNGDYTDQITPYLNRIGYGTLSNSSAFIALLKEAAQKDESFCKCQEFAFRELYLKKGYKKAAEMGIKTALGVLVICDSLLHGSLETVCQMFPYPRPSRGGDEKEFIRIYCETRLNWWKNHRNNPNKTTYRMDCMLENIKNNNWDLSQPFVANGVEI